MQGIAGAILRLCIGLVRENVSPGGAVTKRIDWLSDILFASGIMFLLYYVGTIAKQGLYDPAGLIALALGILLLAYWVWRSLTAPAPLLDVRQFRNRNILVANIVTAFVAMSSLQLPLVFSILLQAPVWTSIGLGVSAFLAGVAKLPSNILSILAGALSGWLTGRGGGRTAMLVGGTLATLGWALAYVFYGSVIEVIIILCVISFGTTMFFAAGPTILAEAAPGERTSEVPGMLTVVRSLFQGIGAMLITTLLATEVVKDPASHAQYPTQGAFHLTIGAVILLSIFATICAFALPRGRVVADER